MARTAKAPPPRRPQTIDDFSTIAGPLVDVDPTKPFKQQFRSMTGQNKRFGFTAFQVALCLLSMVFFVWWLFRPEHFPDWDDPYAPIVANYFVVGTTGFIMALQLINVFSLCHAMIVARYPVAYRPQSGTRVAFVTAIVPSSEPFPEIQPTLLAALKIRHDGIFDVWLLDEGNEDYIREWCEDHGIKYFSRKGIPEYNTEKGKYKKKTKHGNYNAFYNEVGFLNYDFVLSVDGDHRPLACFAERMLGAFWDPNVAYVTAPQNYANCDNFVTTASESQQFPFHSIVQPAGNAYRGSMLVGTNYAMRMSALEQIDGFQDSITEDMKTGMAFHTSRNPDTGKRWKSIYTPDVVSLGEGPASWGDQVSQQLRWSRGTFEVLILDYWRYIWKLSPGQILHYTLILTFYPSMALGWIFGCINAILYMVYGASGLSVPYEHWLAPYVDTTVFQLWLYFGSRRYNVSPHEEELSFGVSGMLMSVLTAPVYATSFLSAITRRKAKFVVTPKGQASSADSWHSFKFHYAWAVLLIVALTAAMVYDHATPQTLIWPIMNLVVCFAPKCISMREARLKSRVQPLQLAEAEPVYEPAVLPSNVRAFDPKHAAAIKRRREAAL